MAEFKSAEREFIEAVVEALGLGDTKGLLGVTLELNAMYPQVTVRRMLTQGQMGVVRGLFREYSFHLGVLEGSGQGRSTQRNLNPDGSMSDPYPGPEISPPPMTR